MIKENLYKILGLPKFASTDEIKKAYRKLAMECHPDRGGDEERMKKINVAYQILSEKKKEYDIRLKGVAPAIIVRYYYAYGQQTEATNATSFGWTFNN